MKKHTRHYIDIELVKKIMMEKAIDDKKMAELMEVSVATVKRFLNGANQQHMSCLIFVKVSRALGVSVNSLLHKAYRI